MVIRAGRRRPHPRHWQDLAKLVGIQGDGSFTSLTFVHSGNCPLQRHRVCENGRGLCQARVGRAKPTCIIDIWMECRVAPNAASRVLSRTRVSQNRLATTNAFRKTPTSCKSLKVAETGSSDSVTLGLLLASLESLFYQRMAISLKSVS